MAPQPEKISAHPPGLSDVHAVFVPLDLARKGQVIDPSEVERTAFREALIRHMDQARVGAARLSRETQVSKAQIDKLHQRKSETTNVADALRLAAFFGKRLEDFCAISPVTAKGPTMNIPPLAPLHDTDHPLWGWAQGTVVLAPGTDLTEPVYTTAEMDEFLESSAQLINSGLSP